MAAEDPKVPAEGMGAETSELERLKTFEERQRRELHEFEDKQREQLDAFERKERRELEEFETRKVVFHIKIDRAEYDVSSATLTGAQLRELPKPPIGSERDLFEVVPSGSDRKILNDEEVQMRDGLRFFTAPAQINPGLV